MAFGGVIQRVLAATGKKVGGGPKKKRGPIAKVIEKVSQPGGGAGRPTTPNSDDEGTGMRGLMRRTARRAMRRAY